MPVDKQSMDDRKLESLLRMAAEVDDLERSATQLRLVHTGARRRLWLLPVAAAMATAAACLAIVTLVLPSVNPPAKPNMIAGNNKPTHLSAPTREDFQNPLTPSTMNVASTGQEEEASVVLAFFEGIDGKCTCLHIQDEEWDTKELAEKGRGELLDVAYRSKCGSATPSLLVVAIAGKKESLPRTAEAAEALASKLSDHTRVARAELSNRAYQAVPGLPAGSMVVTETVGNRSQIMDFAKFSPR
jgi:hypothetical protein